MGTKIYMVDIYIQMHSVNNEDTKNCEAYIAHHILPIQSANPVSPAISFVPLVKKSCILKPLWPSVVITNNIRGIQAVIMIIVGFCGTVTERRSPRS